MKCPRKNGLNWPAWVHLQLRKSWGYKNCCQKCQMAMALAHRIELDFGDKNLQKVRAVWHCSNVAQHCSNVTHSLSVVFVVLTTAVVATIPWYFKVITLRTAVAGGCMVSTMGWSSSENMILVQSSSKLISSSRGIVTVVTRWWFQPNLKSMSQIEEFPDLV